MTTLAQEIALPEYAGMADRQIADAINAKTVKVLTLRYIGYGSVMSSLGATAGGTLLNTLESLAPSTPSIKWALRLLDRGELDISDPVARGQIDALCAGGVMTTEQRDALKALGETDGPYAATLGFTRVIDPADVAQARG